MNGGPFLFAPGVDGATNNVKAEKSPGDILN
jgi:hypothetical protein